MTASMIAAVRRTIVLADSAKFNHKLLGHIASLEPIDILVTDAEPPRELFRALKELEVQVLIASPLKFQPPPKVTPSNTPRAICGAVKFVSVSP